MLPECPSGDTDSSTCDASVHVVLGNSFVLSVPAPCRGTDFAKGLCSVRAVAVVLAATLPSRARTAALVEELLIKSGFVDIDAHVEPGWFGAWICVYVGSG
jgi:hypothetical protein